MNRTTLVDSPTTIRQTATNPTILPVTTHRNPPPSRFRTIGRALRTPKSWLTGVFLALYLVAAGAAGYRDATAHLLFAIVGACLPEVTIVRLTRQVWRWPTSAFLSGAIIGFILGTEELWFISFLIGAISTVSKHLIKTRRGHVFNPAAFALLIAGTLFGSGESWWGALAGLAAPWMILLLLLGIVIVDRVEKYPTVLVFLATYFALLSVAGLVVPRSVAELFRDPFVQATLFFAFFMLTDPPTSPGKLSEQVQIGSLVAVVSVSAQLLGAGQTYLLVGLLIGNAALVLFRFFNQWRRTRLRRARAAA